MKHIHSSGSDYKQVDNPFFEELPPVMVDMTEHTDIAGHPVRVELRRTRDPATALKGVSPSKKLIDSSYIIGIIDRDTLPREGEPFKMAYHNWNDVTDFGNVHSKEPIRDLVEEDGCYYFTTSEGQWRLKVLDVGN